MPKKIVEPVQPSFTNNAITVGDLIRALKNLPKNAPIIYSHDDEGNEYQTVNHLPSIMKFYDQEWGRDLERVEEEEEEDREEITCVCIN